MNTKEVLDELISVIDDIYSIYLDSSMGFVQNKRIIEESQKTSMTTLNLSQEHLDNLPMTFGAGAPGDPNTIVLHQSKQGDFKSRNERGGRNHITLGNLCIVLLYQYWEDYYRGEIANSLSKGKNEVHSDVFGDLRLLRNSILHHRSISLDDISRYKIFKWFNQSDVIQLSPEQVDEIFLTTKAETITLRSEYCR